MKTGAPWRTLPACFGKWQEVIFSKIIETADTDEIGIDSTFVKVHQHALSGSKKGAVLVNPNLSAGNINDSLLFEEQIKGINLEKVTVLADRGYSTYEIIEKLREKGATICIPPKSNIQGSLQVT